ARPATPHHPPPTTQGASEAPHTGRPARGTWPRQAYRAWRPRRYRSPRAASCWRCCHPCPAPADPTARTAIHSAPEPFGPSCSPAAGISSPWAAAAGASLRRDKTANESRTRFHVLSNKGGRSDTLHRTGRLAVTQTGNRRRRPQRTPRAPSHPPGQSTGRSARPRWGPNMHHRPRRSWLGTLPLSERRLVVLNRRASDRLDLQVPLGTLLARHTRLGHRDVNNVTRLQLAPQRLGRLTDGDLTTLVS